MKKRNYTNDVSFIGEVVKPLKYSHSYKDIDFYKFYISVKRYSKVKDIIPVVVELSTLTKNNIQIEKGTKLHLKGMLVSYGDNRIRRILVYVFAKEIELQQRNNMKNNEVNLCGRIAKKNPLWVSPKGKRILNIVLAIDRSHHGTSYIPCLLWNLSDSEIKNINVGSKISATGRLQSREYEKETDSGQVINNITYEVSVNSFSILD